MQQGKDAATQAACWGRSYELHCEEGLYDEKFPAAMLWCAGDFQ